MINLTNLSKILKNKNQELFYINFKINQNDFI